jgi:uncharacterized protein (TIGR02646 family)
MHEIKYSLRIGYSLIITLLIKSCRSYFMHVPYCEINFDFKLDNNLELGAHIEHVVPRNVQPERTFDYTNFVLSCLKEMNVNALPYDEVTCGHYKDRENREDGMISDEQLFISPLEPDCQRYFIYDPNGRVRPHPKLSHQEQARATYTINLLGLNNKRLVRLRRERLETLIPIIDELRDEPEALGHFADMELCLTGDYLQPFHSACLQQFGALGREIVKQCLDE